MCDECHNINHHCYYAGLSQVTYPSETRQDADVHGSGSPEPLGDTKSKHENEYCP